MKKIVNIRWSYAILLTLFVWKSTLLYAFEREFLSETYGDIGWMPESKHVT